MRPSRDIVPLTGESVHDHYSSLLHKNVMLNRNVTLKIEFIGIVILFNLFC